MWWQRSGTAPEAVPVFHATQVSREILMFQLTVVEVVIGDVPKTLQVGCQPVLLQFELFKGGHLFLLSLLERHVYKVQCACIRMYENYSVYTWNCDTNKMNRGNFRMGVLICRRWSLVTASCLSAWNVYSSSGVNERPPCKTGSCISNPSASRHHNLPPLLSGLPAVWKGRRPKGRNMVVKVMVPREKVEKVKARESGRSLDHLSQWEQSVPTLYSVQILGPSCQALELLAVGISLVVTFIYPCPDFRGRM